MPLEQTIFFSLVAIQVFYYLFFFLRLNFVRGFNGLPISLPPVSVVICARNQAETLKHYLKIILIQQYPQFEVVVVNDESTDNTADVLFEFYQRNKNLKIVNIPVGTKKNLPGKKYALSKGIETASYNTLVLTDADCRPATTFWLAKMTGAYMNDTSFVLGYSPYEKRKGLLNKVIRMENFMSSILCFGFAKAGLPYMGVGRNLSYQKSVLVGFKGYEKHKDLLTGDDDLLVNEKANGKNTEICLDSDAYMYTAPKETLAEWLTQKKRHLRSGFRYKLHHSFLLFVFSFSLLSVYVSFFYLLFSGQLSWIMLTVALAMLLLKMLVVFRLFRKLAHADLKWLFPLLEFFYTAYLLIIFFLLLLQPKDKWK